MTEKERLTHVFTPFEIGAVTVKNRIVRTAHGTALGAPTMAHPGEINDAFIAYHEARARGGVGLTILEIGGVHATGPTPIRLWEDSVIPEFERLMAALEPYGMPVFQQLYHGGHHDVIGAPPTAPWSASDVASPYIGLVPHPMTKGEIDEMVGCYAAAARRAKAGGLQGVEVHAAHGYLPGQFLSLLTNRREDDYGGSFENRLRFPREVLAAIRAEVGTDFPVGIRLSAAEAVPGGLDAYDTKQIAAALAAEIDFLDISFANYHSFERMLGGMHEPRGFQLPYSSVVSDATEKPTIVTGRIPTLEMADEVIASGVADLVSMVRATIADPELVRKTQEGRAEEVRPCIYCNQGCIGGYGIWGRIGCTVNVAAGRETEVPSDEPPAADAPGRVVVVGGGPAGLEAARTAALSGHRVTLFEREDRLGGRVDLVRELPSSAEMTRIVDWLAAELDRLEVEVRLGETATAAAILAERPDHVIIATGARLRSDALQVARPNQPVLGTELPHVGGSEELFSGRLEVGSTALVLDDVGSNEAIACAEELRRRGAAVTFVTRHATLGSQLVGAIRDTAARRRLVGAGFELIPFARLSAIAVGEATVASLDDEVERQVAADTVVLVSFPEPRRELADELGDSIAVSLVGDANSPRELIAAIHEGHLAARSL